MELIAFALNRKGKGVVREKLFSSGELKDVKAFDCFELQLYQSFRDVEVVLHTEEKHIPKCLVNGETFPLQSHLGMYSTIISLHNDVEHVEVSFLMSNFSSISLRVAVLHHYTINNANTPYFLISKWTMPEWEQAFSAVASVFLGNYSRKILDLRLLNSVYARDHDYPIQDINIRDIFIALFRLLVDSNKIDWKDDFGACVSSGADVSGTISMIKANPSIMQSSEHGVFEFKGKKYTPVRYQHAENTSNDIDFSEVINVLDYFIRISRESNLNNAIDFKLLLIKERLTRLSSSLIGVRTAQNSFFTRVFRSKKGQDLQKYIFFIGLYLKGMLNRQGENVNRRRFYGYLKSAEDHSIFEDFALLTLFRVMGVAKEEWNKSLAYYETARGALLCSNHRGGLDIRIDLLPGWREQSIHSSNYLPDFIVFPTSGEPIIVDAKFRISKDIGHLCSSSSMKEMQAYMDEFHIHKAIIIVPLIPRYLSSGDATFSIEGRISQIDKKISVIELSPLKLAEFTSHFYSVIS